jgi:hypothetical protein
MTRAKDAVRKPRVPAARTYPTSAAINPTTREIATPPAAGSGCGARPAATAWPAASPSSRSPAARGKMPGPGVASVSRGYARFATR